MHRMMQLIIGVVIPLAVDPAKPAWLATDDFLSELHRLPFYRSALEGLKFTFEQRVE